MTKYLEAEQAQGKDFYLNFHDKGKVVMLNLLKYKQQADYTDLDSIRPEKNISGEEAYKIYMQETMPFLNEAGSRILFYGKSNAFLIGPTAEKWDAVLLMEHQSVKDFMLFAEDKNYLKIVGHRMAALADSRLLPIDENESHF